MRINYIWEMVLKVFLVTANNSKVDYSKLNKCSEGVFLVYKALADLVLENENYDFLIVEQAAVELDPGLERLRKMVSLDRVFLILDNKKEHLVNEYLDLGVRDVFVLPVSFVELSTKLRYAASMKKRSLFANTRIGMSLKQILILEILKMQGPQGATRAHILKEIWDNEKVEPKNVDVHIHNLRKVLKKRGQEIVWKENRWLLVG